MKLCDFYYEELAAGILQVKGFFPNEFVGLQTTRLGGVSTGEYESFNLATHVGDAPQAVARNRERLAGFLPGEPVWLEQVHGSEAVGLPCGFAARSDGVIVADASFTAEPNQPCAVMTADCLPLLVAFPGTGHCAAIHAGWRGLAAGVIENTFVKVSGTVSGTVPDTVPDTCYVWLGPAIGQEAFEVGPEVREKFVQQHANSAAAFLPSPRRSGHFMASLAKLALLRLQTFESVNPRFSLHVAVDQSCVFDNPERFFSFRRNPETGRMASVIFRRIGQKA